MISQAQQLNLSHIITPRINDLSTHQITDPTRLIINCTSCIIAWSIKYDYQANNNHSQNKNSRENCKTLSKIFAFIFVLFVMSVELFLFYDSIFLFSSIIIIYILNKTCIRYVQISVVHLLLSNGLLLINWCLIVTSTSPRHIWLWYWLHWLHLIHHSHILVYALLIGLDHATSHWH